jgi:hypothetical protein
MFFGRYADEGPRLVPIGHIGVWKSGKSKFAFQVLGIYRPIGNLCPGLEKVGPESRTAAPVSKVVPYMYI